MEPAAEPDQDKSEANHKHSGDEQPQIILNGNFLPAKFRTVSFEIARDAVKFVSRGDDYCHAPSRSCSVMRDLVTDTIRSRPDTMSELVRALDVNSREDLTLIKNVANSMFDDEQVSWGRIVTLHAFCGCLAQYCESTHIPDCADDIGNILGEFMVHRLGLWIVTHGGWGSFGSQFPNFMSLPASTGGIWKGLLILGLLVGACCAFYTSVRFINMGTFF